jgi:hypothetical protein
VDVPAILDEGLASLISTVEQHTFDRDAGEATG